MAVDMFVVDTPAPIRQHTSAYVRIRPHTSAYVRIRPHTSAYVSIRQHTSAYVRKRQHTSAYVRIRQHTSAYVSVPVRLLMRDNFSHIFVYKVVLFESVSCEEPPPCIRQRMSAYVSIR